jgi:hypothetical protein
MIFDQFIKWERQLAIRRSAVLFTTLWMTWEAFAWAKQYASALIAVGGGDAWVAAAAMVAAVTAPITALQVAVFKAYIDGKSE